MVDYHKDTGSTGTMRIRDTGTFVEYWINSGNSTTFANQMPWGYTINGVTNNNKEFRYNAGSGWEYLGGWDVNTSQTVTFRLFSTGTSGLGGPTTFSVAIKRAKAPNPPSIPVISNITHNSMTVSFTDGSNNGAGIDVRAIARNTSNTLTGAINASSDGSTTYTGLISGQTYYFWARTHNSEGWSSWSGPKSATTFNVPPAPDPAIISDITQTSFWVSFTGNGGGGLTVLEYAVYYNTVPNETGIQSVTYVGGTPRIVEGLEPATTYYVWARARTSAGWGPYSEMRSMRTVGGAWVTVGPVIKEAIPYVNVGGVWTLARPWVRAAGVWKETI
jgi:hypothetical protein